MSNLGQQLAHNIQREKQAATNSAAALEQMRTEEARKTFLIAKSFFDNAKAYFVEGITRAISTSSLFVQVGGARYSSGIECHEAFEAVLEGYEVRNTAKGPDSLYDPKRFASLWSEFSVWARSEGLVPQWKHCHDGAGMDSWWRLTVAPGGLATPR